jgi:GT2 family glycosyltransferase
MPKKKNTSRPSVSPKKDLAVIIVNYNTRQLLNDCLDSIYKAAHPQGGIEVVVVDNNSPDDSVQMVKKKFKQVTLIKSSKNLGFAKGNNTGFKKTNSRFLLFLNSDTIIEKDSLIKPLKYLKKNPSVGIVTIKLLLADGSIDYDNNRGYPDPWTSFCHFSGLSKLFPNSSWLNNYHLGRKNLDRVHQVPMTAGSFMMMPTKVFEEVGYWCEDYFFYGEDLDICHRINQAGYKIIYYPKTTTLHLRGASSGLRKESKKFAKPPKETRIKVAQSSINAMRLFYGKFYADKYPKVVTWSILTGIALLGQYRILKHKLT